MASLQAKELENVLRPVGIEPFLEVALRQAIGQEERRQAPAEQAVRQVAPAKRGEVGRDHRREPDLSLAARERVPKAGRGTERGRARREHPGGGEVVGGDLQHLCGIGKAVDLVEDDGPPRTFREEGLRIVRVALAMCFQAGVAAIGLTEMVTTLSTSARDEASSVVGDLEAGRLEAPEILRVARGQRGPCPDRRRRNHAVDE